MRKPLSQLKAALQETLSGNLSLTEALRELTLVIPTTALAATMQQLRDDSRLSFDALIDVAGVDYQAFAGYDGAAPRFAVVYHLLSIRHNWRLRVRTFVEGEDAEASLVVPSVVALWPSANWMERECFDMFGIAFDGHPDLRRILTDYGFTGHPFRKDFPLSGHLEMRYDPEQKRVIYEPVTIPSRENVPRIVRELNYGNDVPIPVPVSLPPGALKGS